jgi:hypothetical protein
MLTEKVEIGFDLVLPTGPFFTLDDAIKGQLDNTLYPLAGFQYYDITEYVTDVSVRRGKSDYIANISSGELVVTLNNLNRYFDPLFAASPFFGNIKPKRVVRYSINGVQAYQGVIDDWNLDYNIDGEALASFSASDGFVYLNNQTLPTFTATAQLSGARINAILDNEFVLWPSDQRDIDSGTTTFGADVIPDNQNVLQYLQQAELSELGLLFIGKTGTLIYRDRSHIAATSGLVSFADDGTGIGYSNMIISYGSENLINEVVANSIITTTELTASDLASQGEYGIFNQTYSDLLLSTDAQVESFATTILAKYSEPVYSFKEVEVRLNELDSADLLAVLNLELGDFVQVTFTPSNVPPAIIRFAQIIRLTHNVDVSGDHVMTFGLDTLNFTYLVLDDTVFGRLDEGALA